MAVGVWLVELHGQPVGRWLRSHDPDGRPGAYPTGTVTATDDPAQAMRFPTVADALAEWRRVSATSPTRPDGKPNRPLSAYTIQPKELP